MLDSLFESPLDLSITALLEPGPGLLVATSRMTTGRAVVAAIFGLACLALCAHAWTRRADLREVAWPHGALIPVFGAIALVLGFGHHRKAFDAGARTLTASARLGPFASSRSYALPDGGSLKLAVRRERSSRAGGKGGASARWYDITILEVPAGGFTIASDREAARAFTTRLASVLHYGVFDEVEDDGVERSDP